MRFLICTLLIATLVLSAPALAETRMEITTDTTATSTRTVSTIDNAPEEKERGLAAIDDTISHIQTLLLRCESDVCRLVRANADKRHELTHTAQQRDSDGVAEMREVQGIVQEDIQTLSRCETNVCQEVLALEQQLLVLVNDYLDADSDGDGLSDGTERASGDLDGDGLSDSIKRTMDLTKTSIAGEDCDDTDCPARPGSVAKELDKATPYLADELDKATPRVAEIDKATPRLADGVVHRDVAARNTRATIDKATPLLYQGLAANNLSDDERKDIGVYLRSKTNLTGRDFGLAVAYAASNNSRVQEIRFDNATNSVEVVHVEEVRLFGVLPVRATARSTVHADGDVETNYPWWGVFARKGVEPTRWMAPESIRSRFLDPDDDGDGIPTQENGEEVDILGMGDEKLAGEGDVELTESRTGRNPQTGKEIQIAASIDDDECDAEGIEKCTLAVENMYQE